MHLGCKDKGKVAPPIQEATVTENPGQTVMGATAVEHRAGRQ
jgi:hypothetical protein